MGNARLTNTGMLTSEEVRFHIDTLNNESARLFDTVGKIKTYIEEIPYDVYMGGGVQVFAESMEELSNHMISKKHVLDEMKEKMETFSIKAESDTANMVATTQSNLSNEESLLSSAALNNVSSETVADTVVSSESSSKFENDPILNQNNEIEYTFVNNTVVSTTDIKE